MYFWNVNALVQDLKNNRVSEFDKFLYFLLTMGLLEIVSALGGEKKSLFELAASLGITALGIYACFQGNNKGDGQHFIERMICLSIPIGLHVVVILIPIFIALLIAMAFIQGKTPDQITQELLVAIIGSFLLEIIFYTYLYRKVTEVAK